MWDAPGRPALDPSSPPFQRGGKTVFRLHGREGRSPLAAKWAGAERALMGGGPHLKETCSREIDRATPSLRKMRRRESASNTINHISCNTHANPTHHPMNSTIKIKIKLTVENNALESLGAFVSKFGPTRTWAQKLHQAGKRKCRTNTQKKAELIQKNVE